ncbi:MAG TPA: hypothetical protein VEX35_04855 [Allosphingosinicella sp.]|nr:hypothetical protein [Allosphingosinicella sp.]
MTKFETFKLSELRLDEKNYRTGPVSGPREAIQAIIADQKQKLVNLAKDILEMGGISPGEPLWVYRDASNGTYVVVEGNRRVTALKLMENPLLADGTTVEREFRALAIKFAAHPIREVTAAVFSSYEAAAPWRRRRHLSSGSGVGLEGWKTLAKARADRDHGEKARRVLSVVEFLQDDSDEWQRVEISLDPRWTTVERVLNARPMKAALGVDIDTASGAVSFENGDIEAGKRLLRAILSTMAAPGFEFADVEKFEDRGAFLNRFVGMSVKAKPAPPAGPAPPSPRSGTPPPPPPPPPSGSKPKRKPDIGKRDTLAPGKGARVFAVSGVRLNGIYNECRKLKVKNNENAGALLLRVFIELSSEALLAEKNVSLPSRFTKAGKLKWDDIGIPLAAKIQIVIDLLDPTKTDKTYQPMRLALDAQSHGPASINTLHGYFHNRQLTPHASDVMKAWDIWEPYLSALHAAR